MAYFIHYSKGKDLVSTKTHVGNSSFIIA